MVDNRSVAVLSEEHNKVLERYKDKEKQQEKTQDDGELRVEMRTLAQEGLGLALKIQKKLESICAIDDGKNKEYAEKLQRVKNAIDIWMKRLGKLGSSISGIPNTTFDDIAGLEEVKQTVKNYLFALQNPEIAKAYNISTNVGMLLYGPPGTGKTLIAKAIAHELGVRFFVITPSMIFGSYVGESEKNVRDVFTELRACKDGAVLLVDECESIFARRDGDSNRSAIGVANQLLQEMNGVSDSPDGDKRVILGATNRPWLMDEAYLRYKRFSLQFYIGMPDPKSIAKVIQLGLKKLPCDEQLQSEMLMTLDSTYTCADISGIIEQCAYLAMQEYHERVKETGAKVSVDNVVKVGVRHFAEVLKTFRKSVQPELLKDYEDFKESRKEV